MNPAYFDMADLRIQYPGGSRPGALHRGGVGLSPAAAPYRSHEAALALSGFAVAAYPVVWCLAGEGTMPYYLSKDKEGDRVLQKRGWTEVGAYVRSIDPYHHPVTIHPPRLRAIR